TYKDYRDGGRQKELVLPAAEFLLHVLPPEFVRIRHYGLLANGKRAAKLTRCRELLGEDAPGPAGGEGSGPEAGEAQERGERCANCGVGRWVRVLELAPLRGCASRPGAAEAPRSNPHRRAGSR